MLTQTKLTLEPLAPGHDDKVAADGSSEPNLQQRLRTVTARPQVASSSSASSSSSSSSSVSTSSGTTESNTSSFMESAFPERVAQIVSSFLSRPRTITPPAPPPDPPPPVLEEPSEHEMLRRHRSLTAHYSECAAALEGFLDSHEFYRSWYESKKAKHAVGNMPRFPGKPTFLQRQEIHRRFLDLEFELNRAQAKLNAAIAPSALSAVQRMPQLEKKMEENKQAIEEKKQSMTVSAVSARNTAIQQAIAAIEPVVIPITTHPRDRKSVV